ncbi:unnamed protein product [Protopolystoma xenopodis]|uniref:Uncharacterized protein n=1 Tax=Protopolystoma xenopodis TaxID=117903 RepID=A0A448XIK1_9PLAT|nr:unnamed protein product [Protopolystoma xenopodis]
MTDKSFAPFHLSQKRLPCKPCYHDCSSKAIRELIKRNPSSSSGGIDLRISSPNNFTRNGKYVDDFESGVESDESGNTQNVADISSQSRQNDLKSKEEDTEKFQDDARQSPVFEEGNFKWIKK